MEAFALAVKEAIESAGTTQTAVAEKLGMSLSTFNGYIRPDSEPNPRTAIAIEEACGVEPGTLTIHLGFLPPAARDVHIDDPEGAIIADDTLTGEHKQTVMSVIKGLRAASS